MRKRLERMKEQLPGEELLKKPISRKAFVAGAGATSFGLLLAACGGGSDEAATTAAPPDTEAPPADTGGDDCGPAAVRRSRKAWPTACTAARSASPAPSATSTRSTPRRAARSRRSARWCRTARRPTRSSCRRSTSRSRSSRTPFETPDGAGASIVELFEEETGIKIEFVETTPADEYQTNLRNASTKNGSFDAVTSAIEEMGDFAEAGLLLPLDEYVDKYQPSWSDPEYGYAGGETTVTLFTKYKGVDLLRRVRQRHPAVRLPLRPVRERRRAGALRGQVRLPARLPARRGTSTATSPSSSRARTPTRRCTATS